MKPLALIKPLLKAVVPICMLGAANLTFAQAWPNKPVTIVVPFPAGGTTDVLARAIATKLGPVINQSVIVDNRPGAGSTLGAALVAKATPDGHTLLMGAVHHTIATSVYKKLSYDFQKDFAPITVVALVPNVLVVSASKPFKTVNDLIADAKSSPEKLAYGSNGNGTAQHLIGTQFQMISGTKILHVPYKGSAPLTTDMLGGQVDMSFDTVTPVLPFIKQGKLRPLAVTTAKRSSALPDVPTMQEAGIAGLNIGTWFGLLAPAATPKDITEKLNKEIVKIINTPEFQKQMTEIGAEPVGNTQKEMAKQIQEETDKFAALVKAGNVKID